MLKFDTCCEVAACGHVWSQLPTLLQPFFLLEALSASGSPFSGHAAHVKPFCRTQGGPFAGHASGWLRTLVFSEWGPSSASHHSDSSLPPYFATYVTVQGPVWPNTKFPPPDPSLLTGIALDVAPVLYQSIHFHHLSMLSPFAGPHLGLLQGPT